MRSFVTALFVGSCLALSACAGTETEADYSYEAEAPYADERTVGAEPEGSTHDADRVFMEKQRK